MSHGLHWLPIVLALACPETPVAARKWEYRKERFEADLVDVDGRTARLLRPDGELRGYTVESLGEADRRYVERWVAEHVDRSPGEGTQVTARAYRETVRREREKLPPEPVLVASLGVWGPEAAGVTYYRDLTITEAVADDGTSLTLSPLTRGKKDDRVRIDRYDGRDQPIDGFCVKLSFSAPETSVRAFRRIRGSLTMVTGKRRTVIVDEIYKLKNDEVADEHLTRAGLRAIVNPSPPAPGFLNAGDRLTVYGVQMVGPNEHVFSVDLINTKGEHFDPSWGRGWATSRRRDPVDGKTYGSYAYHFELRPPESKDLGMRITVLEDPHSITVPFEITDLAIPPLPPAETEKE